MGDIKLGNTGAGAIYLGNTLIVGGGTPPSTSLNPQLLNFNITDAQPTRVYFDSSKIIQVGVNGVNSFKFSYRTISGITISSGNLTGHYFTLSSPVDYWNINTIRYTGVEDSYESDIIDNEGNKLHDFTLTFVVNNINEPSTTSTKWASANGSGTGDGSSAANSWSYAAMGTSVSAGDHVNVLAGARTGTITFNKSGTSTNPIVFEGYKLTPGDITSNYMKGQPIGSFDDTEMPTIIGTSRLTDVGLVINDLDFVVFRNLQIRDCRYGVLSNPVAPTNLIFERVNGTSFGNSDTQADVSGYGFHFLSEGTNKVRVIDCHIGNASQNGINMVGNNNLIINTDIKNDQAGNSAATDYMIALQGDRNVVKGCYIQWNGGSVADAGGFGVSVKARYPLANPSARYNLLDDLYIEGIAEALNFRWEASEYNVAKYCTLNGGDTQPAAGGLVFRDGASFNIFEYGAIKSPNDNFYAAILFSDTSGEQGTGQTLEGNIVRNTTITGGGPLEESTVPAINLGLGRNGTNVAWEILNCKIQNCTFYNIPEMFNLNTGVTLTNFEFTNNIIIDIPIRNSTNTPNLDETYNDHWNFWGTNGVAESGVGNISIDPKLDVNLKPTIDTPVSVYEGGTSIGVEYDKDGVERKAPYSIGAYEKNI